jgi:hypothetical protein
LFEKNQKKESFQFPINPRFSRSFFPSSFLSFSDAINNWPDKAQYSVSEVKIMQTDRLADRRIYMETKKAKRTKIEMK